MIGISFYKAFIFITERFFTVLNTLSELFINFVYEYHENPPWDLYTTLI
jgi:hypothetical protein